MLEKVAQIPKRHRSKVLKLLGQSEWDRCAADIFYWLDETRHPGVPYVYTHDPHPLYLCLQCGGELAYKFSDRKAHLRIAHHQEVNNIVEINGLFHELPTIRAFTIKPYIPPIITAWLSDQFLFIEKSRDMIATWTIITCYTWDTLFHKGRQNILQSEDAGKTMDLVKRAFLIYKQQPRFLRDVHKAYFAGGSSRSGQITIPDLHSEILGFPQGPDQIRQYHPTGIYADEAAYQIAAGASFTAAKPAIEAGGRYTAVSSANPSWFQRACEDTLDIA